MSTDSKFVFHHGAHRPPWTAWFSLASRNWLYLLAGRAGSSQVVMTAVHFPAHSPQLSEARKRRGRRTSINTHAAS